MKVSEICSYAPKSNIKAGDACDDGKYMFFTSSADESKRFDDFQNDGEGIVMGTGGNATLHYYNGKFAVSTDCVVLLPDEKIRCKYLYYFFLGNMRILEDGFKGAGLKHTNKGYIGEIDIGDIPSFEKQDKVIEILDSLKNIIDLRTKEIEKLDKLIKARFVELFGDPEFNSMGWESEQLGNVCKVGSSKRIYQNEQSPEGIPFLRISDLVNRMDTGEMTCDLYIPESRFEELLEQELVPIAGDILLTARGTLGRCYIVKPEDRFYFQDGMISWLYDFSDSVTALYISYLFDMPGFRKQIDGMQAGSTVAYLSISMTKKLVVMLPPIKLQEQFADFVEQVDKSKVVAQQMLDEAQILFDSLMQEYFG